MTKIQHISQADIIILLMEAKPIHHIIKYKTKEQHDQIYYEYFYTFEPYEVKRSQYFYYQPIFFYNV